MIRACHPLAALCSVIALALFVALPRGWLPMWIEPPAFLVEILLAPVGLFTGVVALSARKWDAVVYMAFSGWICYEQFLS